jgi:hypothetical protein
VNVLKVGGPAFGFAGSPSALPLGPLQIPLFGFSSSSARPEPRPDYLLLPPPLEPPFGPPPLEPPPFVEPVDLLPPPRFELGPFVPDGGFPGIPCSGGR